MSAAQCGALGTTSSSCKDGNCRRLHDARDAIIVSLDQSKKADIYKSNGLAIQSLDNGAVSLRKINIPSSIDSRKSFDDYVNLLVWTWWGIVADLNTRAFNRVADWVERDNVIAGFKKWFVDSNFVYIAELSKPKCNDDNCTALVEHIATIIKSIEDAKKEPKYTARSQENANVFNSVIDELNGYLVPTSITTEKQYSDTKHTICGMWIKAVRDTYPILYGVQMPRDEFVSVYNTFFSSFPPYTRIQTQTQTTIVKQPIDKNIVRSILNQYSTTFSDLKEIAKAEIENMKQMLTNLQAIDTITKSKNKLNSEINEYSSKIEKHTREREALEQQFVDERKTPDKIKSSKIMVLQDYILAAFIISYVLAAFVGVAYFTTNSSWWVTGLLLSGGILTVLGAIIYSTVLYVA